jgi:hypothetical protein
MTKTKQTSARTDLIGALAIETWYDRRSRNWITRTITAQNGYEVDRGPAVYTGNQEDALAAHRDAYHWAQGFEAGKAESK